MKNLARILVLLVCLGALGALMWRALEGSVASPGAVESEREQRTIAYIADADTGPRFTLPPIASGGTSVFRLLSYLHLPFRTDPETYSPESRFEYGVRWVVREADGQQVARGTIWMQTRKSKADFSGGSWRKESVYYSAGQGPGEPADARLIDVDLTSYAGRGRTVEFLAVGVPSLPRLSRSGPSVPGETHWQVNLVVFKQYDREEFRQQWLERTLSSRRKAELADYARVKSWSELTGSERQAMLDHGWARQSSLVEVATRTLYESDFRLHESALIPVSGDRLGRRHHLVYNLRGPARLKVVLRDGAPQDLHSGEARRDSEGEKVGVQATFLSTSSGAEADIGYRTTTRQIGVRAGSGGAGRLRELARQAQTVAEIPAGQTASVRLLADVDRPLRALAFIDRRQAVMGEAEVLEVGTNDALLRPDWKTFSQWELRPGKGATFTIAEDGRTVGQALRISLRGLATGSGRTSDATLIYRFSNDEGILASGKIDPSPDVSSFERLAARLIQAGPDQAGPVEAGPDQAGPDQAGPDGAGSELGLLSEPTTHRFWLPKGATRLELDAEGGSLLTSVAALVFSEDAADASKPAPYHESPAGLSWRYAPSRFQPWQSFYPSNVDELEAEGQRRWISAQVRLRPDWDAVEDAGALVSQLCGEQTGDCAFTRRFEPPEPPQESVAVVLAPQGKPLSRLVAEPADLQPTSRRNVELLARQWDTSFRTRLEPGATVTCKIERGRRIALDYQFSDFARLGAMLQVLWDGEPVERRLIRTQRDRIYVRPPGSGRVGRLEVQIGDGKDTAAARVSLTADCSPASATTAASVVRLRRVWRLRRGRSLRVRVPTTAEEAPTLYVAAYAPGEPAAFEVSARVDRGAPRLRNDGPVAQITAAERTLTFEATPARVELQSSPPRTLTGPSFAAVPTGTDWAPGWHEVELRAPEGRDTWVRFYTKVVDAALRAKVE